MVGIIEGCRPGCLFDRSAPDYQRHIISTHHWNVSCYRLQALLNRFPSLRLQESQFVTTLAIYARCLVSIEFACGRDGLYRRR